MKKSFSLPTVSILFFVALLLGMQINNLISGDNIFEQLNKFKDVLSLAEKYYVDDVDTPKMVESAINGMLSNLDPHSIYIPVSQLPRVNEDFQGSFEGIGVEYAVINDTLIVVTPITGGPSEMLGILAGDKIIKINDSSAVGIKQEDVPKKLRGPKGTHVKVAIHRSGEKNLIDFDITRDKIPLYSVDVSYMIDQEVGYISVNRFSATTYNEFVDGITKLQSKGLKKLIIDLRNNGGGLMDQAVKMVDELLPYAGKKIVYTKARRPEFTEEYISKGQGKFASIPIIILVNAGSASASEIVSGAIQDWDRGLIVGETTFGKGLVQRQFELPDKSAFRLTIARYYTPSGRLIQRPYGKDLEAYRKEAFDRKEEEGDNVEHNIENNKIQAEEKDSTKPVFQTASGRNVYGGGGITPDYIVKAERASTLFIQILGKGVFREYALGYIDRFGKQIQNDYGKDLKKYLADFTTSDTMLSDFETLAKKKGVVIDSVQYEKDKTDFRTRIKAEIARIDWGNEGWFSVYSSDDHQLQKALGLFPEAAKIAGLN
jgi:carboxyl-terminal processing protease